TARADSEMVISHSTHRRTNQRPTRTDCPPYLEPRKDSFLCRDCSRVEDSRFLLSDRTPHEPASARHPPKDTVVHPCPERPSPIPLPLPIVSQPIGSTPWHQAT